MDVKRGKLEQLAFEKKKKKKLFGHLIPKSREELKL